MDVNGFIFHCNDAMANCAEAQGYEDVVQLDFICLKDLQTTFAPYKSWAALQDSSSELVMFLHKYCKYEGKLLTQQRKDDEVIFDELKLKVLGLLWCHGKTIEKAKELYVCAQEAGQEKIACNDKEFKQLFTLLLNFATEVVFRNEPLVFNRTP